MNSEYKAILVEMLNNSKCYSKDLKKWLAEENISFGKEDSKIFELITDGEKSILFGDKLRVLFELVPELDYMYYFNSDDCLMSKLIKDKQYDVIDEMIKEPASNHGEVIKKENLTNTNSANENIMHVYMKNIISPEDLLLALYNLSNVSRLVIDINNLVLQKDEVNKDFVDYMFEKTREYNKNIQLKNQTYRALSMIMDEIEPALVSKKDYNNINDVVLLSSEIDNESANPLAIRRSNWFKMFLEIKAEKESAEIKEQISNSFNKVDNKKKNRI